jgi:hypothetical protein
MAVMREVNPRDTTAEAEFLKISVNAFEPLCTLGPTRSSTW